MTQDKTILIRNIYYMLSYAFTSLRHTGFADLEKESFDNIHNLFAAILEKGIARQLKQGLFREYTSLAEDCSVMRGKLEMAGTIRNQCARKRLLTCEVDELRENHLLNQILKTTALLLLRSGRVEARYQRGLRETLRFFSAVDMVDPRAIPWSTIRFQRNNRAYQMLIGICRLVLEGMLLTTEAGDWKLASFVDDQQMSRLYEKFLLEYYRQEWKQLRASAPQISWALDDSNGERLPIMQTDITLSVGNRELIIDAKYYASTLQGRFGAQTLRSEHLYQIYSYVKNRDAAFGEAPHSVSGMLLYAGTMDGEKLVHRYRMHGNEILIQTLDLNRPFSEIAEQLNGIAADLLLQDRMSVCS